MNRLAPPTPRAPRQKGCGPFAPVSVAADSLRLTVFERIRAEGSVARATIAKDLAISPATVTTQTSALIDMGFLIEAPIEQDDSETSRGRPPIGLAVRPEAHLVIGLKLSDKVHTAALYDFAGRQMASATLPAGRDTSTAAILAITDTLMREVCHNGGVTASDISAVGVGVPGFVHSARGSVHWSPLFDGPCLDFADRLATALGCPAIIENDANLIALAELWFGVGRQISDFAVVTIEHGVGMGLVIGHKLYAGARGMGMELGHTKVALDGALCRCGQRGCLEAYVSDYALAREADLASRSARPNAPIHEVLEALYRDAKAGNATAKSVFDRAGKYLALGMGNVANLFDPELIILSGDRMQYDYLYSDEILQEMKRFALNSGVPLPPVEVHAWGDLVWASGAAAMALSHLTVQALSPAGTSPR